ncbi:MAG: phenylalanine--tRNA ligase subunit beta [Acidimicrobiia bacterium]
MTVLLSWLREFAPFEGDPVALGEELSDLGMAVEELDRVGEGLGGIVVARVLETRPIPGANRIHQVVVDAGGGEPVEVGCGAFNMSVGDLVPLATVGTVMPNGMEIGRRKMAGVVSDGMLCSSRELGLGDDHGGILLLPGGLEPGTPFAEAMGIEPGDVRYDLEINPNRPDAMSVAGVARDLAARLGLPFSLPEPRVAEQPAARLGEVTVEVLDPDLCGRFVARVLRGIAVGPSEPRVATRLTLLGMRPINNVVDASNYVMLELGQPNHPYDLARVAGPGFRVRRARRGEVLVTLDDVERTFEPDDLLICDAHDAPIGIAGIMGGASSEIDAGTTDVLLEMAWFRPIAVAKTARRLRLRSEASARFEKGTDPEVIDLAVRRFAELLGPGVALEAGAVEGRGELPPTGPVAVRVARVNSLLGTDLSGDDVAAVLDPIGFASTVAGDTVEVRIPSWRYDCAVEIDVVEEVARHHGYQRIGRTVPSSSLPGGLTARQRERRRLRAALVGLGLSEAMPMPFLAPGELARAGLGDDGLEIANPLVAEESILRTSLRPGLLAALAYNASHRNLGVGLFELGHVFARPEDPAAELPDEREHLGVAWAGRDASAAVEVWRVLAEVLAVRDVALVNGPSPGLHPTRAGLLEADGQALGRLGEVDPEVLEGHGIAERVAWLEVDLDGLLARPHGERAFRPFSLYPSSDVDLAFEVDEAVPASTVEAAIRAAGGPLLWSVRLFDVYRGPSVAEGRRSLAYALRFQAPDRTLTDDEVGAARRSCIDAVESALPATLRG